MKRVVTRARGRCNCARRAQRHRDHRSLFRSPLKAAVRDRAWRARSAGAKSAPFQPAWSDSGMLPRTRPGVASSKRRRGERAVPSGASNDRVRVGVAGWRTRERAGAQDSRRRSRARAPSTGDTAPTVTRLSRSLCVVVVIVVGDGRRQRRLGVGVVAARARALCCCLLS